MKGIRAKAAAAPGFAGPPEWRQALKPGQQPRTQQNLFLDHAAMVGP